MSEKKDISKIPFRSIAGWRGDSLCCPQAFGGDIFSGCSMGCWWCFCREMEEELYTKYYNGWSPDLVRPCNIENYKRLFDKAFGTDKEYKDWNIKCLRRGLPFNMGSKSEPFSKEDFEFDRVAPVLELFRDYQVPVIFETKSHYCGMSCYLDIIKDLNCAIIISIMGGTDTLNYKLEPYAPTASMRWDLVKELNDLGIWCGVRWEPIMPGINSRDEILKDYAECARKAGARHVSFYNYRSSNYKKAKEEFEKRGYNYIKMLEKNLDENWKPIGERFFDYLKAEGVPASSPDFVNFPFFSDRESCCGVDGLFTPYEFTLQHACSLIRQKGNVCWEDMEEIDFKEPKAYEGLKWGWNGNGQFFTLADSPDIIVLDVDSKGRNIYGAKEGGIQPKTQKMGFFQELLK